MRRPLANALDIELAGGLTDQVTPHAGSALLIEVTRRSGVVAAVEKHLPAKQSTKGLRPGELVEAFILVSALGGECLDDFTNLRRDRGLAAVLGYDLPAASTARQWLDRFHDPEAVADRPAQGSFIPPESAGLAGLRAVVEHSVRTYCAAVQPGPAVTLDVDAHLVEASKQRALRTDEGFRGYQPLLVSWAETDLVLADEFRDGHVPASARIAELVDQASAALPHRAADDPWQVSVRSDSAAYEQAMLDHWHTRGWRFAVSADLSKPLQREIVALPSEAWTVCGQEATGVIREWAEVAYVPSRKTEKKDTPGLPLPGDPGPHAPGGAVRRRCQRQALRGRHQRLADRRGCAARLAARQGRHHRTRQPRPQE
jgi:Transposase DDE domain group 1